MAIPSRDVLPLYEELPEAPQVPARLGWGVFGPDDRIGTVNLLTPDRVRMAATLVRSGRVFPLNWELEQPDPPILGRRAIRHAVDVYPHGTDDHYDDFYPQSSTQWDALSHIGHPHLGYFGGASAQMVGNPATNPLGVEHWARRGIVGRFVLLDVGRHMEADGRRLDMESSTSVTVGDLEATLERQGVRLAGGDILLIRFGWIGWYRGASRATREALTELGANADVPGLEQSETMAAWLWDNRVAAVAGDNPGVERYPADPGDIERFLHYRVITFLGMAIGELFDLDGLATDCNEDGRFEGLFAAAPLNKRGGSGSTANALAIK